MATIEIKVPVLPESVSDATIAAWHKKPGDAVKRDENLVDIETDKVVLEVVAPEDGILETIKKNKGETVKAQEIIGMLKAQAISAAGAEKGSLGKETSGKETSGKETLGKETSGKETAGKETSGKETSGKKTSEKAAFAKEPSEKDQEAQMLSPSARRRAAEKAESVSKIQGSEKGRRTKEEFVRAEESHPIRQPSEPHEIDTSVVGDRIEKRVPMTRLRARIAERLLQAQQSAAILTTFNEINMQPVISLRSKYKETFEKNYGVRLGFMSFFTLAVVEALKHFPIVNASIDGNDIVYHGYYDIGIAVSSPRGLVVPILRNAEALTMAEIEKHIADLSNKAKEGQLTLEEITGGTFTISNGGVFGSLMSTPILNPPQSGILGMHKIQERPVVENGEVVIRPMMYVALSYDHRIIDGADSVRFLVTVKELLEDPARLALGI